MDNPPFTRKFKKFEHKSDFEQRIIDSDHFIVFATERYFTDGMCFVQTQIANWHNKPFIILAKNNIQIPDDYLSTIAGGYQIVRYETDEEKVIGLKKALELKEGTELDLYSPYT